MRYVERLPNAPPDDRVIPDLSFGFYDRMVIFDHAAKTVLVVAHATTGNSEEELRKAYAEACRRVDELVQQLPTRRVADIQLTDINPKALRRAGA